mmetsp:Transcript_16315/g.25217  ORF Transcript_16315/g.25217 Transcript_16315/m.25217 type:complete len:112 (+) Transcript_16315:49-384(+)
MSASQFLEKGQATEDFPFFYKVLFNDDLETVKLMKETLPFFDELINETSDHLKMTPLMIAVHRSNFPMTQFLLDNGSQIFQTQELTGDNILHIATLQGDVQMVDYILNYLE